MNDQTRFSPVAFLAPLVALAIFLQGPVSAADPNPRAFGDLPDRLIGAGFDTSWIRAIYADGRVRFLPDIAKVNIRNVEDTATHLSFSSEENLAIARDYFRRHRSLLADQEIITGVPAEIVVAILLVETKCGRDRDKAPVLDVLSTIAASAEPAAVFQSFELLNPQFPDLTPKDVLRRARRRSRWAFTELRAFLKGARGRMPSDISGIRGSWAGAIGLPQFMPTSVAAYGADGDGDGQVDLQTDADAVASVCNYLKMNGWKRGVPRNKQRRVILRYNKSGLYADAVMRVADRISSER